MASMIRLCAFTAFVILSCIVVSGVQNGPPRTPNVSRMARAVKSISEATKEYNEAVLRIDRLFQERFNPKIVVVDPDLKRQESVAAYKAAKEALLKQVDAYNELIEEEDY